MIYLNSTAKPVLRPNQINEKSQLNYSIPQISPKKPEQEFFKTKLTKAHLIYFNSSLKVEPKRTYVVGHNNPDADSICSAIAYAYLQNKLAQRSGENTHKKYIAVCPGEINLQTKEMLSRFNVSIPVITKNLNSLDPDSDNWGVSMIDHNQTSQSIEGVSSDRIKEIIDHHAMGHKGIKPLTIHTEPVGATATIVADMFKINDVEIPPDMAGILLGAILSDTFNLKSNATQKDIDTADYLANKAGIDRDKFGNELVDLLYMNDYENMSAKEIVHHDLKAYHVGTKVLNIGQVSIKDHKDFLDNKKSEILDYMNNPTSLTNTKHGKKPDYFVLMITNIETKETCLLFTDNSADAVQKAFGKEIKDNTVILPDTLSRKSQIEPNLKKAIEAL